MGRKLQAASYKLKAQSQKPKANTEPQFPANGKRETCKNCRLHFCLQLTA
jgi:hypothetical protein